MWTGPSPFIPASDCDQPTGHVGDSAASLPSEAGGSDSTLPKHYAGVRPGAIIFGLLILVFHLTRLWTFWKLMFHSQLYLGDVDGVMLFQLYMQRCCGWLKILKRGDCLQQRCWPPRLDRAESGANNAVSSRAGDVNAGTGGSARSVHRFCCRR